MKPLVALVFSPFDRKLICNNLDDRVIFQEKMQIILWPQPQICEYLHLFPVLYDCKLDVFCFLTVCGTKKATQI